MKKVATKSDPKAGTVIVQKHAGSGKFTVVRGHDGQRTLSQAKGGAQSAAKPARPAVVAYDAEDIEEANRIGAALCRQHAR